MVAFGIHLILIFDTATYTLSADYSSNADLFTAVVAVPAVLAEAAFTIWLLARAGRESMPAR